MASLNFKGSDTFQAKLEQIGMDAEKIAKGALYSGAGVMADKLREAVGKLPIDYDDRRPYNKVALNVITAEDREDLANGIGVAVFSDENGKVTTAISFNGYTRRTEKKYPNGVPLAMIARSIESGSSVRDKHPFVRPTVKAAKAEVLAAMQARQDADINTLLEG